MRCACIYLMHTRSTGMCAGFDSIRPVYYNYVMNCPAAVLRGLRNNLVSATTTTAHVWYNHLSARIWRWGSSFLLTTFTWNWWAMREEKKCIQFNSVTQPAQMSISHMFLRLLNRKVLIMRRGWRTSAWAQAHRTADDTAADISNSWVKSLPPPPSRLPFEFGICIYESWLYIDFDTSSPDGRHHVKV